jgi:putative phage-type endonuclease
LDDTTAGLMSEQERQAFLESRQQGLGGSDVAAVAGLDPYRTPMDVYLEKVRPVQTTDPPNIHMLRGQLLEPVIAALYAAEYDRPVARCPVAVHPSYPWARAHADRTVTAPGTDDDGVLEIKAPGRHGYQRILEVGVHEYWIPQIHWEMFCAGRTWGSYAIGNLEHQQGPIISFDVAYDELLVEQLLALCDRFWHDHVLARVPPDTTTYHVQRIEMPATTGERVTVADPQFAETAARLMERYELKRLAEELLDETTAEVKAYMDDRSMTKIDVPGVGRVNYDWRAGRESFDHKMLARYAPLDPDSRAPLDLSLFTKRGDDYRAFRPYPTKEQVE